MYLSVIKKLLFKNKYDILVIKFLIVVMISDKSYVIHQNIVLVLTANSLKIMLLMLRFKMCIVITNFKKLSL